MEINPPLTLLQQLHSKGNVEVSDLKREYIRIQQLRKMQGQGLVRFVKPVHKPAPRLSMLSFLFGHADKVIALVTGVTAGVRMIKRIKRLF